jgi:hypothetical protein
MPISKNSGKTASQQLMKKLRNYESTHLTKNKPKNKQIKKRGRPPLINKAYLENIADDMKNNHTQNPNFIFPIIDTELYTDNTDGIDEDNEEKEYDLSEKDKSYIGDDLLLICMDEKASQIFKNFIEANKLYIHTLVMCFNNGGINILEVNSETYDKSIIVKISAENLTRYILKKDLTVVVEMADFVKVIHNVEKNNGFIISVFREENATTNSLSLSITKNGIIKTRDILSLSSIDAIASNIHQSEFLKLIKRNRYTSILSIDSKEFKTKIKNASKIGEKVSIDIYDKSLDVRCHSGNNRHKHIWTEHEKDGLIKFHRRENNDNLNGLFKMSDLTSTIKFSSLSHNVRFYMAENTFLVIEFDVGYLGIIQIVLGNMNMNSTNDFNSEDEDDNNEYNNFESDDDSEDGSESEEEFDSD